MRADNMAAASEREMANAIRALAMDAVQAANSGHPGAPMGMADVATVLFNRFINIDPDHDKWPDRDRFVMSAGHGSMLLYALSHLTGYDDMDAGQLRNFRQLGSRTAGHPEYGHAKGIETTTGPLGQGVANAVGMALAERMHNARFGDELVDHYTYVIVGDGCLMEGISHEAIDLAGHLALGRLIVLWDDNKITIDGATDLATSTDQCMRFAAAGWDVRAIDGHDNEAVAEAVAEARATIDKPSLIACRTIIGKGAPNKQGTAATHGSPLGEEEIRATREALGWPHEPFVVPDEIRTAWRSIAERGNIKRVAWSERLAASAHKDAFETSLAAPDPATLDKAITALKKELAESRPTVATRKASQTTLEAINAVLPDHIGGSADLTGSNNTRTSGMRPVTRSDYSGTYIHYGVREHAMAAAMNGIALHGGFTVYGGTFLVFADYCRPSIRLSALMGVGVTYVFTHDSIGLGEDGPTHQPVETIAGLRAIPNLNVIRPADATETAEAWLIAAKTTDGPVVLCLSRQNLRALRTEYTGDNMVARGAYVMREAEGERQVTLIATGSEVALALDAADILGDKGVRAAVVSAPSFELFASQDHDYRMSVLGDAPRVGVEAAVGQGWDTLLGPESSFVGMSGFGASAPAEMLYRHFGITPEAVADAAMKLINQRQQDTGTSP